MHNIYGGSIIRKECTNMSYDRIIHNKQINERGTKWKKDYLKSMGNIVM